MKNRYEALLVLNTTGKEDTVKDIVDRLEALAEISAILKEQIKNFGQEAEVSEVGQAIVHFATLRSLAFFNATERRIRGPNPQCLIHLEWRPRPPRLARRARPRVAAASACARCLPLAVSAPFAPITR